MSGRLPQLKPDDLAPTQSDFYDSLVTNKVRWAESAGARAIADDGSLLGPFNPLLFNPVLGAAQISVFRDDKNSTSLSARVHEIVILTVGAAWQAEYELYAHRAVAKVVGLPDTVIDAMAAGETPELESEQEASAYNFSWQLAHNHRVDPTTYDTATRCFDNKAHVDMVLLIGLYMTVCSIINAFEIPVPESQAP
jgi:4-carboxymuconolactone decarboxylase